MAEITIPQKGGQIIVTAKTTPNNTVLTTSGPSWVSGTGTVTATSMTLTVAANTGTSTLTGTLNITAKTQTDAAYSGIATGTSAYTLTQAGAAAKFVVVTGWPSGNVSSAGTTQNLTISANTSWTLSSNTAWGTLSNTSGTGNDSSTLTIAANTATTSRSVTITVGGTGCTPSPSSKSITQNGAAAPSTYNWNFSFNFNGYTAATVGNSGQLYISSASTPSMYNGVVITTSFYGSPASQTVTTSSTQNFSSTSVTGIIFLANVPSTSYPSYVDFDGTRLNYFGTTSGTRGYSASTSTVISYGSSHGVTYH